MTKSTDDYAGRPVEETLGELGSDLEQGLDAAEAVQRLAQYGPNEIEEKEEPLWHRIFRRFWGPIPWMIEAAAILSALVQKWEDFIIILVMLLVNAFLDFIDRNLTNAVGEGLNRIVKNRASGYRNLHHFADRIYLAVGDLDIPAQIPSDLRTL